MAVKKKPQIGKIGIKVENSAPFILLSSVVNQPGIGARICSALLKKGINIDSFNVFSAPGKERVDILIELNEKDLPEASYLLRELGKKIQLHRLLQPDLYIEELSALTVKLPAVCSYTLIAEKIFNIFASYAINVWSFITTRAGEIRMWVSKEALDNHPEIIEELKSL